MSLAVLLAVIWTLSVPLFQLLSASESVAELSSVTIVARTMVLAPCVASVGTGSKLTVTALVAEVLPAASCSVTSTVRAVVTGVLLVSL